MYFPAGLQEDGTEIKHPNTQHPIYAACSIERVSSDVLLPLMLHKKYGSLVGQTTPLGVPFVKDLLPELDQLYMQDVAERKAKDVLASSECSGDNSMIVDEAPISEEEAESLKKAYAVNMTEVYKQMAEEHINKNVIFLTWSQDLLKSLEEQPMIKSGAARLWWFNGGTDSTKDPYNKASPYRMKSLPDEDHSTRTIDLTSQILTEADTAIIVSGRNHLFMRDCRKVVAALRPRVSCKSLEIQPDEAQVLPHLRVDANNTGTIDLADPYLELVKHSKVWISRKGVARRFVPGNTALRVMAGVPILTKENMTTVSFTVREAVFKHVAGSDKWAPGNKHRMVKDTAEQEEEEKYEKEEEEEEEQVDQGPGEIIDTLQQVVLFFLGHHPRVRGLT